MKFIFHICNKTVVEIYSLLVSGIFIIYYYFVFRDIVVVIYISYFSYIKKVIEDSQLMEEGMKLLQFCCWENPHLSRTVLSELLWQIAYAYCHELRHYIDLLLAMLFMEDSWQTHRIHNALKGDSNKTDRRAGSSLFFPLNSLYEIIISK